MNIMFAALLFPKKEECAPNKRLFLRFKQSNFSFEIFLNPNFNMLFTFSSVYGGKFVDIDYFERLKKLTM